MKALVIMLLPLVAANMYKETQNFQYSRTGDGEEKKGYYGSQSGNMGGNYELSHNMDTHAQRQMKGLAVQVGSQLGIDPLAIGTGAVADLGPSGSVFGSASTRGTAYGIKGVDGELSGRGVGSGRYGTESRRSGAQSFGTQQREFSSSHSDRLAGQRLVGGAYEDQEGHASGFDSAASSTSQSASRQTGSATGRQYTSGGSRYNANRFESNAHLGETGDIHGSDHQTAYVPVAGVRQVGWDTPVDTSQHSGGSRYHSSSTGYEQSRRFESADGQRQTEERIPIIVRPGTTVRVTVPGQRVVLTRPAQPGRPVYTQDVNYAASAHDQTIDSQSQLAETDARTYDVDTDVQTSVDSSNRGRASTMKGYESSYSYQKEWEKHGSTGGSTSPSVRPVPRPIDVDRMTDMGRVAQNRDKLLVGGLEVGSEDQGSTVYNSGSRVASTGRRYGASQQTYREASGEAQQRGYNAQTSRVAAGSTYDQATNHQEIEDSEGSGSQIHSVQTKPKSYQSSYSYQKSWEKHGTPYTIEPTGQTAINSGALIGRDAYRQNAENQDMSHSEAQNSRYGSSHSTSSSRSAGAQYGAAYGASHGASQGAGYGASNGASQGAGYGASHGASQGAGYGASHAASGSQTDALSTDMASMQQRLREQMGQACPECATGKTKGYSAHYSYSAQRSYGGNAGAQQPAEHHRRRRSPYHDPRYNTQNYKSSRQTEDMGQHTESDEFLNSFDKLIKEAEELMKDIENVEKLLKENEKILPNSRSTEYTGYYHSPAIVSTTYHQKTENFEQTEDMGQQTEPFSHSGKLQLGNQRYGGYDTNAHLGVQTQGQIYHQNTQSPRVTNLNKHLGQSVEDLGQQTEDLGQQTQDFSTSENYDRQFPRLQIGLSQVNHQDEPTSDLGQQTQDMGQPNLWFTGSERLRQNSREPKAQDKDLGQQTETLEEIDKGFITMEPNYNYKPNPKLQAGRRRIQEDEHLGQETEEMGQQTQGSGIYTQNIREPKLQVGSLTYTGQETEDLGQQTEDLGQQTQGFSGSGIYTQNIREPKHQVGSLIYTGQETEDLGQQTQGFSGSGVYTQNTREPKLQAGSLIYTGQETEDVGQQTQGFSGSGVYTQNIRKPKLQVGSSAYTGQETEDLGQETEDLGQQTQDLGQPNVSSNKKLDDTERRNIEYDDNRSVNLQVGSILQQNEFFGRHEGNLRQSTFGMEAGHQTGHRDTDAPFRGVNAEYKSTTERNIRLPNSFNYHNKVQNKDLYEGKPKQDELINSHLEDILKELAISSFHNDGHNTQSKIETLQEQHRQTGNAHKKLNKDNPIVENEFEVALEYETPNSDGEQALHKNSKKDSDILEVVDESKPALTSQSFLAKVNAEESDNHSKEKSFLDTFYPDLHKNGQTDQAVENTRDNKLSQNQPDTNLVQSKPVDLNFEQEEDDGGQQTVEAQWNIDGSEDMQVAVVPNSQLNHQRSLYTINENIQHQTAPKENEEPLQKAIDSHEMPPPTTTTEKPGFWKRVNSGIDKAKDKAKSWFG